MWHKPKILILVSLLLILFGLSIFGWNWWQNSKQIDSDITYNATEQLLPPPATIPDSESSLDELIGETPLPPANITPSPTASSTKPKKIIPTPTPTLAPTPISSPTLDVSFTSNNSQPTRLYNDGANAWQYQTATSFSPYISWPELSSFWSTLEDTCVEATSNQAVQSKSIGLEVFVDGNKKLSTTWGDREGVPSQIAAGGRHIVCFRTTEGAGTHAVKFVLNGNHQTLESNYANNEKVVTYEIKADNEAPSFSIAGPVKETDGTCFHLNDVRDNVSTYSQMTKLNRFDNNAWSDLGDRLCITGVAGESHTYFAKITDAKGNITEKSQTFTIQ